MPAKSRSFSIYLLKRDRSPDDSLVDSHGLEEGVSASLLPVGSVIFLRDTKPQTAWWKVYFGVDRTLEQSSKGALVFVPVDDRWFALCFGHVAHNLNEDVYEHDFGLRVTLNCVDPDQLKNTDVVEPGAARRQRTQVTVNSDLTYFDFDRDSKVLRSLTGVVRAEHSELIRHVTGASNLRITSAATPGELPDLCSRLLRLYAAEDYKTSFPDVSNITPVRDPDVLRDLDARLLLSLQSGQDEAYLSVPDLINYSDSLFVRFQGAGSSLLYPDVYLDLYREYLEESGSEVSNLSLEDLRHHKMQIVDENGAARTSYSIYKSLIFDTNLEDDAAVFHLVEGSWYRFEGDYVTRVTEYCDARYLASDLPDCAQHLEGEYNEFVGASEGYISLDKTDVSPSGQTQVEPCDIYSLNGDVAVLTHVKISTSAQNLSHLFSQGVTAAELILGEPQSRTKLESLVRAKAPQADGESLVAPIATRDIEVRYAIITHKDASKASANLPLFSRINFMRCAKNLELMRVRVSFGFVRDVAPDQPGLKKQRKPRQANGPAFA